MDKRLAVSRNPLIETECAGKGMYVSLIWYHPPTPKHAPNTSQ